MSDDEHRAVATEMCARWEAGESKSALEIEYWADATSHGKRFSAYARRWLGRQTERKSGQTTEIERLQALLRARGVSPSDTGDIDEHFLSLARARESALAAVRVYADPVAGFRSETFIQLMLVAWSALFQAMLEREGRPVVEDPAALAALALPDPASDAVRANLDFFLRLRDLIAHRYLPSLDGHIVAEAQALLVNFENLVVGQFGAEAALGERLCVPVALHRFGDQASGVRPATSPQLPADIQAFLSHHREHVSEAVLRSPEYALQVFFVAVPASRQRPGDAGRYVVPAGAVPAVVADALQLLLATSEPEPVAPTAAAEALLRPAEVVVAVRRRLPYRFTSDTHQRAWKHYRVRPAAGSAEPEATDERYCRWDHGYGYTQEWVERLVTDLSDPARYESVAGFPPEPRPLDRH
jgi:hypothetical protein